MNIISINDTLYNADLIYKIDPIREHTGGYTYIIFFLDKRQLRIWCDVYQMALDEGLHWNWRQDHVDSDAIYVRLTKKVFQLITEHRNKVYELWSKSTSPYPRINVPYVNND